MEDSIQAKIKGNKKKMPLLSCLICIKVEMNNKVIEL